MAQRGMRFKVIVLAGAVFVLAAVDVVALTFVIPLARSHAAGGVAIAYSADDTRANCEQALVLPTRDRRTPWLTRTPTPTATPWLILSPAPQPPAPAADTPAMDAQVEASETPENTLVTATVSPPKQATNSILVTMPTPTLDATATTTIEPPTGSDQPAESPRQAETPIADSSVIPADDPAATPAASPSETSLPPAPSDEPGSGAEFEAYVRDHYNTIAGQPLDILSLTYDLTNDAFPRFTVEIAGSETTDVFTAQPAEVALDYGRRLLDDAKSYFNAQNCAIAVVGTYTASDESACLSSDWCNLAAYDPSASAWTITWTYVRGTSRAGSDTIETWKTGE